MAKTDAPKTPDKPQASGRDCLSVFADDLRRLLVVDFVFFLIFLSKLFNFMKINFNRFAVYLFALFILILGVWACQNSKLVPEGSSQPEGSSHLQKLSSFESIKIADLIDNQAILSFSFFELDTIFRNYFRENYAYEVYLEEASISMHLPDSSESFPYFILIGKKQSNGSSISLAYQIILEDNQYKIFDQMATHTCSGDPCSSCMFVRKDGKWWKKIVGCACSGGSGWCNHNITSSPPTKSLIDIIKAFI